MKELSEVMAIIAIGAISIASIFACPEFSLLTVIVSILFISIISAG